MALCNHDLTFNNLCFTPFNSAEALSNVTWIGLIQVNFEDGGDDPSLLTLCKNITMV